MTKQDTTELSAVEIVESPSRAADEKLLVDSHVPEKYRGTATDKHDMATLGKQQVLRRNFKVREHRENRGLSSP